MDLGNLNKTLQLQCQHCGWRPPEDAVMEAVQLHCQVEHDTDKVVLDLVPVCTCGATMEFLHSRPNGPGSTKDYFSCPACGNTGFTKRES